MTAPPRPPRAGPDGIDHHIGVLSQAGGIILTRQVEGNGVMTALPQLALHQVPIPADIAAAMDQRKRGNHHLRLERVIIIYRRYQHGKEEIRRSHRGPRTEHSLWREVDRGQQILTTVHNGGYTRASANRR